MSYYSTEQDQIREVGKLGTNAFRMWDGDGNFYAAFMVPPGKKPAGLTVEDPVQAIPAAMTMEEIHRRVEKGDLVESIFGKGMDARVPRLPHDIVQILNGDVEAGRHFSNAILTSRPREEVLEILDRSGVSKPTQITMVADSGAVMQVGGKLTVIRQLTGEEAQLVNAVRLAAAEMQQVVENTASQMGFFARNFPALVVQEKAIGVGIDWRGVNDFFDQQQNGRLDQAIGVALTDHLAPFAASSPIDPKTGKLLLGTLGGPCNVDFRVLSVDKGEGMKALVGAAMAYGVKPTGLFFGGDDMAKGPGKPGTDYYGAIMLPVVAQQLGVPYTLLHTHHPVGRDMGSRTPDSQLAPSVLGKGFEVVRPHLILPTPREVSGLFARFAAYNTPRHGLADQARLRPGATFTPE